MLRYAKGEIANEVRNRLRERDRCWASEHVRREKARSASRMFADVQKGSKILFD